MPDKRHSDSDVKAGLDIPVKEWERAKSLINAIITSAHIAKVLQEKLDYALAMEPANLQHVSQLRARVDRRRETHRQLLSHLNEVFLQLAGHLERAGQ